MTPTISFAFPISVGVMSLEALEPAGKAAAVIMNFKALGYLDSLKPPQR